MKFEKSTHFLIDIEGMKTHLGQAIHGSKRIYIRFEMRPTTHLGHGESLVKLVCTLLTFLLAEITLSNHIIFVKSSNLQKIKK